MTTEAFRLSPQQQHLTALPSGAELQAVARISLRGPLDRGRLQRALDRVVAEHEILRTGFGRDAEGDAQLVHEAHAVSVEHTDLGLDEAATDHAAREAALQLVVDAALRGSSPAGEAPGLRVRCLRSTDEEHDLLVTIPALCADSRTLMIFVSWIVRHYDAAADESDLEEPLQYADVAEWQHELLEADESRPGREFWRAREAAEPDVCLPFMTPGGGAAGDGMGIHRTLLSPEVSADVLAAAAARGVTSEAFLLACWVTLLARLSGETVVRVACTATGRRHDELADALGPLARALPLDLELDTKAPFAALLERVAGTLTDAHEWQECFAPAGGSARFAFQHMPAQPPQRGGDVVFTFERCLAISDRFDCRLRVVEGDGALVVNLDHRRGVLSAATLDRMAEAYAALLADAAGRPAQALDELDLMGATERHALLHTFNDSDADYPKGVCAHHFIEHQARRTPDAVAVKEGDTALTYAELDLRANQLAHHLLERGVGPDVLVALCIDRSVEMVVGILGILKAGGAYVPVDPAYPEERLRFLLEDTRAPVLLTQQSRLAELPETGATPVCVDTDAAAIAAHPTTKPETSVGPENLVYVIYTSGSTGKPKGVVITHEKLVISNTARVNGFGHTPRVFLLLSSVAFDSSVVGLFWTLCGGGTLLLIAEKVQKDLPRIPETIAAEGVSHLLTLPSYYRLILDQSSAEQMAPLETVIVAGEACPLSMVQVHKALLPGVGLFSEYGATETTVFSSIFDCLQQTLPIASLGTPIDNIQMYVLDEHLNPCPTGVPGEVHFGGTAIALGYWRRPGLTAERFIPDPFRMVVGARLYKSGDLARFLENGEMEFLGRIDNQVKIRGYRIELEEIEVALLKHAGIKESAVLALADLSDEKRLVGYVVPEGQAPTVNELRDFLQDLLPEFMTPAVFVFLDDFPRTPNGKVDRKALPEPGSERPELESAYEAPTSALEQALAGIWCEVLGLEQVGVADNFFELGGDSILSIQVVSRAKALGLKLTPRMVFENQTVAALIEAAGPATGPAGAIAAALEQEQGPITGPVPLTPVHHWFFELGLPHPAHWTMPMLLDAGRPLDAALLGRAMAALVAHHDALRACFRQVDGVWTQELAAIDPGPQAGAELVFVEDLSGVAADEQDAELDRRATAHHAAMDLEQGRLVRAVLFERGAGSPQRLLWIIHHLAVDGVSWRVLLEDLATALDQLEADAGAEPKLPAKTTSVRRWADGLLGYAKSPELAAELAYWTDSGDAAAPALPLDHPQGTNVEGSARKVRVALDEDATKALLTEVPKTYNTQINDALLTAFVHTFSEWAGSDRLLLNLEGHGREEVVEGADLSRTVGWFTTDYPARLTDTRPYEPGAALRSIKEQLRAIPGQGFGFGVGRHLATGPAADTLRALPRPALGFNYLGQFDQAFREGDRFRYCEAPSGTSMHPDGPRVFAVEVYGMVSGGRLELDFEYSDTLHERATIEGLAERYLATLRELIDHCLSGDAGGFTKSDFADFAWGEGDLSSITDAIQKSQQQSPEAGDGAGDGNGDGDGPAGGDGKSSS